MRIEKIKKEGANLKAEMQRKIAAYVAAAFGLVAGLAWNEAIKALIEYFFPMDTGTLLAKFAYALVITLVLVLATVYLTRRVSAADNKE